MLERNVAVQTIACMTLGVAHVPGSEGQAATPAVIALGVGPWAALLATNSVPLLPPTLAGRRGDLMKTRATHPPAATECVAPKKITITVLQIAEVRARLQLRPLHLRLLRLRPQPHRQEGRVEIQLAILALKIVSTVLPTVGHVLPA